MIRRLALVSICLSLAAVGGCAPRRELPPPPAKPYLGGVLTAEPWGVGPIRADTYFESPRIRELFPKADVRDGEVRIAEDETRAVINVAQNGVQILEIVDGYSYAPNGDDPLIGKVRLVGGPVRGVRGETIGMSWKAAGFDLSQCEMGVERDRNMVICARPHDSWVTYVFAAPGWDSEEFPPSSLMRARGYLTAIVWKPPPLPRPHRPGA